MDAGPSYRCTHDTTIAQLFYSECKTVFTLQRYLFCPTLG